MPGDRLSPERDKAEVIRSHALNVLSVHPSNIDAHDKMWLLGQLDALRAENRESTAQRDTLAGALQSLVGSLCRYEASALSASRHQHPLLEALDARALIDPALAVLSQPAIAEALAADQALRDKARAFDLIAEDLSPRVRYIAQNAMESAKSIDALSAAAEWKWGPK